MISQNRSGVFSWRKYPAGIPGCQKVGKGEEKMINFEEELKHFQPSNEIEDAESEIYEHDITDMTDIMQQMMMELKRK